MRKSKENKMFMGSNESAVGIAVSVILIIAITLAGTYSCQAMIFDVFFKDRAQVRKNC